VATETIIIIIPIAIAEMAIFIMGADMLLLKCLAVMSRLAMKYSRFNLIRFLIWIYFAYAKSTA
jgi:hypothetical protein